MNIAIDATGIFGPLSENRGIGNYCYNHLKAMLETDSINNYYFINFFEKGKLTELYDYPNFNEIYFYMGVDKFLSFNCKYKEIMGDIIKNFITEYEIDLFYITSPFDLQLHTYKKEWFNGIKTAATVYDIIPYIFKEHYLQDKHAYDCYMSCLKMLDWIDELYVISQSVKDDLINYLSFESDKIKVIWGASNTKLKKISVSEEEKNKLYLKFKIDDKFIMCTGGDDARKNLEQLIIAYSKMPVSLIDEYQLVIVCRLHDDSIKRLSDLIKKNKVKGRVVLTNYVSSEELILFYNLASLMAFPSKYEGFGLPIVEAFACGTPVLTSNNSSLVQIAGDAAVLVDPFDVDSISNGLVKALADTNLEELIQKGYKQLKKFQWSEVAESTVKYINDLKSESIDPKRKKIAFFTPLPPIQSGISDYSVDILNEISKYFDIDVYIDEGYNAKCDLKENINIFGHKKFKENKDLYFDIIYQVGNSEYHFYMWDYIVKYSGTVVLHDYNLHTSLYCKLFQLGKKDYSSYKKYLRCDFDGDIAENIVKEAKNGSIFSKMQDIEVNGFITDYAKKIIVHSDYAHKKLLIKNIKQNVRTIKSYAKIEEIVNSKELKEKKGYADDIVFASFGHVHRTKRVIPILKAFKILSENYSNVKYIFVGKLYAELEQSFNNYVSENGLEDIVKITGYTELDEFVEYIDLADVCFNLRYPYNGETSGSFMRLLAKGKSVIVNRIGSFEEVPDYACLKLTNVSEMTKNQEVEEIYNAMNYFMNKENREKYSLGARKYAEGNLELGIIGKQYASFINEPQLCGFSNRMLFDILQEEIINKNYNDKEIYMLSKTLGYSKNRTKDGKSV